MDNLLKLSEEEFLRKVNADIRDVSGNEEFASALRSPSVVYRWARSLKKMKRNTESQLSNDRAERSEMRLKCLNDPSGKLDWIEFVAIRDRWRADAIRFKNGVENKLDEAMELIYKSDDESLFHQAIQDHHHSVVFGSDEEASKADDILWSFL